MGGKKNKNKGKQSTEQSAESPSPTKAPQSPSPKEQPSPSPKEQPKKQKVENAPAEPTKKADTDFSGIELSDLGIDFLNIDTLVKNMEEIQDDNTDEQSKVIDLNFGPTKKQLKSYDQWQGCDGKVFFPYAKTVQIGKLTDVSAAVIEAKSTREKERLERQKPKEDKKDKGYVPLKQQEKATTDTTDPGQGWNVIDDVKIVKQPGQRQGGYQKWNQQNQDKSQNLVKADAKYIPKDGKTRKTKFREGLRQNIRRQIKPNLKDFALNVKPDWEEVTELTNQTLERLPKLLPVFLKNIMECGEVYQYDESWDKAMGSKPKPLKQFTGHTFNKCLLEDPIIEKLIEDEEADIFTTDEVAAVLMTSTKSNYSWDVEIKKADGFIFIDKRDKNRNDNILNFQTVCESSQEHQPMDNETINGIKSLWNEAQQINNTWTNQARVQKEERKLKLKDPNPFIEDEHQVATRVGYLYRIWKIQEEDAKAGKKLKKICIRCTVHTQFGKTVDGEPRYMNLYAFNEHNLNRTNWRGNIDSQIVYTLNREIDDNAFKASRWIVQSLLAGAERMKIAFVSRKDMNKNTGHVVLGTYTQDTQKWAQQINMNLSSMWSIVKYIVECCEDDSKLKAEQALAAGQKVEENQEDDEDDDNSMADFVLMKDPMKMSIKLYKKNEDDDEESDDDN